MWYGTQGEGPRNFERGGGFVSVATRSVGRVGAGGG